MPTYVYACQICRRVVERRQNFRDEPLTECELCGGELRKVIQPVGIIFNRSASNSSDHEADSTSALPAEVGAKSSSTESSSTESSSTESSSASDTPAPATLENPAAGRAPAKDAPAPAKEPAAPAAATPTANSDDGHRPAQRGSRWTTFIR